MRDPLSVPLTAAVLGQLHESNALSSEAKAFVSERFTARVAAKNPMVRLVMHGLVVLGATSLAVAAAFFFAANWDEIAGLHKMALIASAIVGCGLLGLRWGTRAVSGQAAFALAGVLVGPLLFVYGQTYQTGADAYELFLGWALLLAPVALALRVGLLIVLDVALLEIAAFLFTDQVLAVHLASEQLSLAIALLNAGGVIAVEAHRRFTRATVDGFARVAFLAIALGASAGVLGFVVVDEGVRGVLRDHEALLATSIALVSLAWLFLRRVDRTCHTLALGAATWPVAAVIFRVLDRRYSEDIAAVVTGAFVLVAVLIAAWMVRRAHTDAAPANDQKDSVGSALAEAVAHGIVVDTARVRAALVHDPMPIGARILLGFGTWVGASLVAIVLDIVDVEHAPGVIRVALGIGALGAAAMIARWRTASDLRTHLTFQAVVFAEVFFGTLLPRYDDNAFLVGAAMQIAVVLVVPAALARFGSTLAAFFALNVYLAEAHHLEVLRIPFALVLVTSSLALVTFVALTHERFAPRVIGWRAMGYAAALSLWIYPVMGWRDLVRYAHYYRDFEDARLAYDWLAPSLALVGALVCAFVVVRAIRERGAPSRAALIGGFIALVAVGALAAATVSVPFVALALVVVALGVARDDRALASLGGVGVAATLFAFYFSQRVPLDEKALALALAGAAALGLRALLGSVDDDTVSVRHRGVAFGVAAVSSLGALVVERDRRAWVAAGALGLAIAIAFGLAVEKERIVRRGDRVLFALAPVDPRSLAQGDYMDLRFDIESALDARMSRGTGSGVAIVRLDDRRVATLVDVDRAPQDGETAIEFRVRERRPEIGARSFFFEEGKAEHFAVARFAEVAVAADGRAVLVGLRDAELNAL